LPFDHELKLLRAFKHLKDLDIEIKSWLNAGHYTVRYEFDLEATADAANADAPTGGNYMLRGGVFMPGRPRTLPEGVVWGQGMVTAYATASEQPPTNPISLLIGDALHNMRSSLDALAYALASAFTQPLTEEIANSSEFPIVGDENRKGATGVGPTLFRGGLSKIRGWDPRAQAAVEKLQPYQRGNAFRSDPLWILHDLDRINKHRLLHTTVASFAGTLWNIHAFQNIHAIGPGLITSYAGTVETDTPIGRIHGIHPVDPNAEMHVEIHPSADIAFSSQATVPEGQPVLATIGMIYEHIRTEVLPPLVPFL